LYKGKFALDFNYVDQRRRRRFEEEELFNNYGYYYLKKDVKSIFKGFNKKCYSEPRERRSETEDCECEAQTQKLVI
jgi:hypothetical protein